MNEQSIFAATLKRKTASDRKAFLNEACGQHPALRNRHSGKQFVQFLVVPHGQLNVSRHNPRALIVARGVPGELQHFRSRVLQNGSADANSTYYEQDTSAFWLRAGKWVAVAA